MLHRLRRKRNAAKPSEASLYRETAAKGAEFLLEQEPREMAELARSSPSPPPPAAAVRPPPTINVEELRAQVELLRPQPSDELIWHSNSFAYIRIATPAAAAAAGGEYEEYEVRIASDGAAKRVRTTKMTTAATTAAELIEYEEVEVVIGNGNLMDRAALMLATFGQKPRLEGAALLVRTPTTLGFALVRNLVHIAWSTCPTAQAYTLCVRDNNGGRRVWTPVRIVASNAAHKEHTVELLVGTVAGSKRAIIAESQLRYVEFEPPPPADDEDDDDETVLTEASVEFDATATEQHKQRQLKEIDAARHEMVVSNKPMVVPRDMIWACAYIPDSPMAVWCTTVPPPTKLKANDWPDRWLDFVNLVSKPVERWAEPAAARFYICFYDEVVRNGLFVLGGGRSEAKLRSLLTSLCALALEYETSAPTSETYCNACRRRSCKPLRTFSEPNKFRLYAGYKCARRIKAVARAYWALSSTAADWPEMTLDQQRRAYLIVEYLMARCHQPN